MKRHYIIALLVISLLTSSNLFHAYEVKAQQKKEVLLIYDSLALGTSREGNVEALKRLLVTFGVDIVTINSEKYQNNMVYDYSYVILIRNKLEHQSSLDLVMDDLNSFTGKYLHIGAEPSSAMIDGLGLELQIKNNAIAKLSMDEYTGVLQLDEALIMMLAHDEAVESYGTVQLSGEDLSFPYAIKQDDFAYVTYYKQEDLSGWAIGYVINDWLEVEQRGNMYLMLTEIYPFSDLGQLRELSDTLYRLGIPFLVSTNPLFNNFDYAAAQRYVETLKYIQSRNGTIIVDAPAVSSQTISADLSTLRGDLAAFIDFLAHNGVAPLAASAEMYWFEDHFYISEGLSFYDSAIVMPNERIMPNQPSDKLQSFSSSVYTIDFNHWREYAESGQVIDDVPMNIALSVDIQKYKDDLEEMLQWLSQSWILFADYKAFSHKVTTDSTTITANQGLLTINGQRLEVKDTYEEIEVQMAEVVETEASLQSVFSVQNKIFIIIIIAVLIFFSILLVIGYRMYREKY